MREFYLEGNMSTKIMSREDKRNKESRTNEKRKPQKEVHKMMKRRERVVLW